MAIALNDAHAIDHGRADTLLSRFHFTGALPERVRRAVEDRAVVRRFTRNTPVFWQGDRLRNLPLIVEGHFKLMRNTEGGREVVVDIVGPGDTPCWMETMGESAAAFSMIALENSKVAQLPVTPIRHCISNDPKSALAWSATVGRQYRHLLHQVAGTRAPSVPSRLGGLLLHLLDRHGDKRTGTIPMRLTRQDLADAAGTTVETAIRLMRKWEKAGIVDTQREAIRILDRQTLQDAADGLDY
jgi:CRP/FNR family transcriptional regulator, nitrogen oxide reductase regulator